MVNSEDLLVELYKKRNKMYDYEKDELVDIILENEEEKQQLISFLEDKIKEYEGMYVDNDEALIILQEVLDFVNRGGKE